MRARLLTIARTYDQASHLTGLTNKNSTGTVLSSFAYTPTTNGEVGSVTESDGATVTYGYDKGRARGS